MSERKLPELFGSRVFNEETMKERLSDACYQAWKRCVTDGAPLELATANEIAGVIIIPIFRRNNSIRNITD